MTTFNVATYPGVKEIEADHYEIGPRFISFYRGDGDSHRCVAFFATGAVQSVIEKPESKETTFTWTPEGSCPGWVSWTANISGEPAATMTSGFSQVVSAITDRETVDAAEDTGLCRACLEDAADSIVAALELLRG